MYTFEKTTGGAVLVCGERRLRIVFVSASVARVTYTVGREFGVSASRIVTAATLSQDYELIEEVGKLRLRTAALQVVVDLCTGAVATFNAIGRVLMQEPPRGGRWLTPKTVQRNVFHEDVGVAMGESIDGARAQAAGFTTVIDRMAFEAKLEFVFQDEEALFGLGSHEEGYGNLRGHHRELYQQNMKAVVPYFVSTRGYGVLLDCGSLMTFHDDALGSHWWAEVVEELDYYVIQGDTFDDVTRSYYALTGIPPMLPKWAFGYVQSKERYVNAAEIVDVIREYRRRGIPLDAVVLDWKSWPNGAGWGQKSLDPIRFPAPDKFLREVHALGARLMVSIWPIMTGDCADQQELLAQGGMLGNRSTYNAFSPAARDVYWQQAARGLFAHGVDAWWCDCTEPFEADWDGAVKPEPHRRLAINTDQSKLYLDAGEINAYSLVHSQGIYEGQRRTDHSKRVVNLTRSSYAGQHRYGTITWNGDICGTWETLRRCIPEGVNFCATGEPYWTVDIGGFFVANDPTRWFWRGEYNAGCRGLTDGHALEPDANDTGCADLGYWELYTRWVQYACFLPMFRSHGTDAAREIWRFGDEGGMFYDVIAKYIRLRYRLMPYLYSLASAVTLRGAMMMRAVALEFPADVATHGLLDQYLFGPSLLICPVTVPMYYGVGSTPLIDVAKVRSVYLPAGVQWFGYWDGVVFEGGQTVAVQAPLETLPLFVRAGSIVPLGPVTQYVDEVVDAAYEICVYRGADAAFDLYEDAGDGYGYERGEYAIVPMAWNDSCAVLLLGARQGAFPGLVVDRDYFVRFFSSSGVEVRKVRYAGSELSIQISRV